MKKKEPEYKITQTNAAQSNLNFNWVSLFNAIHYPAQIIDKEHVIIEVNNATLTNFNFKRENIIGKKCYSIFYQSEIPPHNCPLERVKKKNNSLSDTISVEMNNTIHTVLCSPMYDHKGNYETVLHIMNDISEKKFIEDSLITERDKVQKYLNVAAVMLVSINRSGIVELINPKGCEILGYTEEEIVGTNWFDNYIPKHQRKEIKEVAQKVFASEIEFVKHYENNILTKKGEERLIEWNNEIIRDREGNIISVLSSGTDITARRVAENELIKNRDQLEVLVQKRTSELEEKNEKLDRINKLFVGRELRMAELKEEIEKLKKL